MMLWVVLAAVVLLLVLLKRVLGGPKGNLVLLVGPCDSGKTTLFHQLVDGSTHLGTVASMQPNEAEGPLASEQAAGATPRPVRLVDVPGHPRVRGGALERYAGQAAGVVFLVDSVDFMPRKAEAAEQLCEVLCQPGLARRRVPLLLAGNKADLGSKAHTLEFIRKRLEREIDGMRSTRGALGDVGGGGGGGVQLGLPGEPFTFDAHARARGCRVSTATVSAVDKGGVAEVKAFVRRCVPA